MIEADLKDWADNAAIKTVRIVRVPVGFTLVVEPGWKPGWFTLYSVRGERRVWSSLDRLVSFLDRHGLSHMEIALMPTAPDQNGKTG